MDPPIISDPETGTYCGEYAPHPLLRPYIRCYFYLRVSGGELDFPADGCPGFIVNLGSPFRLGFSDTKLPRFMGCRMFGASTRRLVTRHATEPTELVAVKFHPGQLPRFFDFPANELTDRSASLQTLCGRVGRELTDHFSQPHHLGSLVDLLDQTFLDCLNQRPHPVYDVRMNQALVHIAAHKGRVRVDRLAADLKLSRRQLERRFLWTVGLTPKRMCRITRFVGIFASLPTNAPQIDWADLAYAGGYSDQAHLVRECKYFTGHSPRAYLARRSALEHRVMGIGPDNGCTAHGLDLPNVSHLFNTPQVSSASLLPETGTLQMLSPKEMTHESIVRPWKPP